MTAIYKVQEYKAGAYANAPSEAGIVASSRLSAILFAMGEFQWRYIEMRAQRCPDDMILGVSFEGDTPPQGYYPADAEVDGDTAYAPAARWAEFGSAPDVLWLSE